MFGLELQADAAVYVSMFQPVRRMEGSREELFAVVRSTAALPAMGAIRRAIADADGSIEFRELTTGGDLIRGTIGGRAATGVVATIVSILSGCALVLVVAGLHLAVSHAVRRQARDRASDRRSA